MFKQFAIFFLLFNVAINPHGFGRDTFISVENHYYQAIDNICMTYRISKSQRTILSYKEKTKQRIMQKINSIAKGKASCYFAIGFDSSSFKPDITCTPDQEFYLIKSNKWIPAKELFVGDELLTKNNTSAIVTHIELINESIDVFIIEVRKTHMFFVSKHAILTHNIILPFNLCVSIPFGGVAGASIGSFFGPLTLSIGLLAGSVIGIVFKIFNDDRIPKYKLPYYDAVYLNQKRIDPADNVKNDRQIVDIPTADDGYEKPKNWDGKKTRHPKSGNIGWPDSNGNIWVPTKPNSHGGPHWDVQDKKGKTYRNVYPGGTVRKGKK